MVFERLFALQDKAAIQNPQSVHRHTEVKDKKAPTKKEALIELILGTELIPSVKTVGKPFEQLPATWHCLSCEYRAAKRSLSRLVRVTYRNPQTNMPCTELETYRSMSEEPAPASEPAVGKLKRALHGAAAASSHDINLGQLQRAGPAGCRGCASGARSWRPRRARTACSSSSLSNQHHTTISAVSDT